MKKINFIGIADLKTEYILYVCKTLKEFKSAKILLITENNLFISETKPYEYVTNIDILVLNGEDNIGGVLPQFDYADYDFLIHDSEKKDGEIIYDKQIIVSDSYAHHLERNLHQYKQGDYLLLMNLLINSKITTRFIEKRFDVKVENFIYYYLEIKDRAILIDNSFNKSLKIKKLSNYFKESLISILTIILEDDIEKVTKEIKKVWRKN